MLCPHGTDPTMILLYKDEFMLFSLQPWNVPKASCIHQSKTAWVLRAAQEMTLGGETRSLGSECMESADERSADPDT